MAVPYVGEIRMFAGNFAPAGWMFCDGQLLAISENDVLFQLIGTTYGGDGQYNFALPNLQSRIPLHFGNGFVQAETAGVESVTLTTNQIPGHNHTPIATSDNGTQPSPVGGLWAANSVVKPYNINPASVDMGTGSISSTGGNQPHSNLQPYLCVNFIISLFGIFPNQSGGNSGVDPFLTEIRLFSFNFAPGGWALCNGQLLPINQNQPTFALLGTTYGGDGRVNFALPNLQSRAPIHVGSGHTLGQTGGEQAHTLSISEMPAHIHIVSASSDSGAFASPTGNHWGSHSERPYASDPKNLVAMSPTGTANTGGSQAHLNMMPSLVLNYCVALQGIFPSAN